MATIKYKNKATGKEYSDTAENVKILRQNPILAPNFSFEAEEVKPAEPKKAITKPADETAQN